MYCNHAIHFGIDPNLLYNPLNIINGNINAGAIDDERCASLNNVPVQNPILFPTNAIQHNTITILLYIFTEFYELLKRSRVSL